VLPEQAARGMDRHQAGGPEQQAHCHVGGGAAGPRHRPALQRGPDHAASDQGCYCKVGDVVGVVQQGQQQPGVRQRGLRAGVWQGGGARRDQDPVASSRACCDVRSWEGASWSIYNA
jgi:hypothetical protein